MYLKVECVVCGTVWNYYDEKSYWIPPGSTAVQHQGAVCPKCGCQGYYCSTASGTNQIELPVGSAHGPDR